jgi:putative transposase
MRYASVINGQSCWTGHLWQERFFSAPLDDGYFWVAMRYVELNPMKAGMVARAIDYRWSSARAHSLGINDPILTSDADWKGILEQRTDWAGWLQGEEDDAKVDLLRYRTNRDLPCGDNSFIEDLEKQLGRPVLPGPRGRPRTKEPRK